MPPKDTSESIAARLPILVRPHMGESTDNYIRRLAKANHLKPSTLHSVACGPPSWTGKPRLDRLALLAGRPVDHLRHALADGTVPRRRQTVTGQYPRLPRGTYLLYRAIRQDAEKGLPLKQLADMHHVDRGVIRQALTASLPPARQRPNPYRKTPVIAAVRHLVTPMIRQGLSTNDIWKALMDDHGASISFSTLNAYVSNQRTGYRSPKPPIC